MDKLLKQLFDYQKFAQNSHLEEVINNAESECSVLLDDALLAVAGGKNTDTPEEEKRKFIEDK